MKTQLLKHARKLWNITDVPRRTNRANALKWARSVYRLGDHWLLSPNNPKKIERI